MKYKITKTSSYGDKPCDGVYKEAYNYKHERTCTEELFNRSFSDREGLWKSKGFGHTTSNDGKWIVRYEKDGGSGWFIDIDNLTDFIKKHGQCIISEFDENNCEFEIEIYDDYRE